MSKNSFELYIQQKIYTTKTQYCFLKNTTDAYAFSAVCIKYSIYKNPSLILSEHDLESSIIDGSYDGGVDFLLLDPNNTDAEDLLIGQAKYYSSITLDDAKNAVHKMIDFYQNMIHKNYEGLRDNVIHRFSSLYAEIGDESKIKFLLYTSAPQNSIKESSLRKIIRDRLGDDDKFELQVYFQKDVIEEIKESESRRPNVEDGKLVLDSTRNVLWFNDGNAAVVNISASSLKKLYADKGINLLSKNLRYFIKGKSDVNTDVKDTINNTPESFWYKNNGITIICDSFSIDAKELKLKNFSIVNGGQTTYLIFKNFNEENNGDFFIVCKVISAQGRNEKEKDQFILDVAKATNSQKPIKQSDLKANAPEQLRFINALKENGVYYKTKRGEEVPKDYRDPWKNTDISEVGKLSLSGIFQLPGSSRNKPSIFYADRYYNPIFFSDQTKVGRYIRDLLYIDNFFRNSFIPRFDKENGSQPSILFAHNARTICIAYIALCSRIEQGNLNGFREYIVKANMASFYDDIFYSQLKNFDSLQWIIAPNQYKNKDELDFHLYELCFRIIRHGFKYFSFTHEKVDSSINETNFLKKDANYFSILKDYEYELFEEKKDDQIIFSGK